MQTKQVKVAVIGGRKSDEKDIDNAYQIGKLIAENHAILICGGRSGIMEAACKGAFEAGGMTVGILPGSDESDANEWVKLVIPTGIGLARNSIITCACDGAIAIGGKYGTLSEIAYCFQFDKPVCSLNSWPVEGLKQVSSPKEAIDYILKEINNDTC